MTKPRKKSDTKRELDGGMWRLFVQACGGRCCLCGAHGEATTLHRGHIISRNDEGATEFENLIPLCKSCNAKLKDGCAPDRRPLEWRDTFAKLFLASLHLKIRSAAVNRTDTDLLAAHAAENKEVLDFENVKFTIDLHYSGRIDAPPQPVPPSQVEELLRDFVSRVRAKDENLQPPSIARQQEIRNTIVRMRAPNFLLAAEEYIRQAQWLRPDGTIVGDGWNAIAGLEITYLPEALAYRARVAEAEQRQRDAQMRSRWEVYKRVGECGDWPGMTDEERTFRDKAKSERVMREVSAEELVRAEEMPRKEFRAKKTRCADFITLCDQMISVSEELRSSGYSTAFLRERLATVTSVDGLHDLHKGIQELYGELRQYLGPQTGCSIDDF